MKRSTQIATCIALIILSSFPAQAEIGEEPTMADALILLAMAAELADNCENTTLKHLDGLAYRAEMKVMALSLGYSEADSDHFISDADTLERAKETAQIRLVERGLEGAGENNHCLFGLNEIVEDTELGRLIFMW